MVRRARGTSNVVMVGGVRGRSGLDASCGEDNRRKSGKCRELHDDCEYWLFRLKNECDIGDWARWRMAKNPGKNGTGCRG